MFYVYVLRSEPDGRYYVGSTKDVNLRLAQHNSGMTLSTRKGRPWKLVLSETFGTLGEARRREQQIKSWKNPDYMVKALKLS